MNKILILLQQLHIDDQVTVLKNALMDKVVVNQDNSYIFTFVLHVLLLLMKSNCF